MLNVIDLNKVSLGVLVGALGGVAAGVGARIAMRIVALIATGSGSFSVEGTLAILVLGAMLGVPLGLLFVGVRRWLPGKPWLKGLIFGVVGALVFVAPPFFLSEPAGELAIVSPLIGFSLFAPLPVAHGLVAAIAANRLGRKYQSVPERRVNATWPALFGLALLFAFLSTLSLVESPPFPPFVSRAIQLSGLSFRVLDGINAVLLLVFACGYCGLAALIFVLGAGSRMPKLTALALLLFAGAFFNGSRVLGGGMSALPVARLGAGLVQALGLSALLILLYVFPDGRFIPGWTRALTVVGSLSALVWFVGAPPDSTTWLTPLRLPVVVGLLGTGVLAQLYRYTRLSGSEQRRQTRWAVGGMTLAVLSFALLGSLMLLVPGLKPRPVSEWSALFAYSVYLLPWLLIPLSIGVAIWRGGLWKEGDPA
jgi:hypothetical protein